jgi:hypothetical protein
MGTFAQIAVISRVACDSYPSQQSACLAQRIRANRITHISRLGSILDPMTRHSYLYSPGRFDAAWQHPETRRSPNATEKEEFVYEF